jgi:outer membrane protein assembly factor BamB
VFGNSMYFSTWDSSDAGFEESISRLSADLGKGSEKLAGPFAATYFSPRSMTPSDPRYVDPKGERRDAALPQLRHGWSYLGARPTIIDQTAYAAVGDHLVSVDLRSGKPNWSKKIVGQSDNAVAPGQGQPSLTPPSFAGGRLYLGSIWGDMLCVDAKSGEQVWRYRMPDAVTSQVVLDQGMAYATTSKGQLICINTKDASATGWNMWGGSPSHNGPAASPTGAKFNTH